MKFLNRFNEVRNAVFKGSFLSAATDYVIPTLILKLHKIELSTKWTGKIVSLFEVLEILALLRLLSAPWDSSRLMWYSGLFFSFLVVVLVLEPMNRILIRGIGEHIGRIEAKLALYKCKRELAERTGILRPEV